MDNKNERIELGRLEVVGGQWDNDGNAILYVTTEQRFVGVDQLEALQAIIDAGLVAMKPAEVSRTAEDEYERELAEKNKAYCNSYGDWSPLCKEHVVRLITEAELRGARKMQELAILKASMIPISTGGEYICVETYRDAIGDIKPEEVIK